MKGDFDLIQAAYKNLPSNPLFGSWLWCQWISAHICIEAIDASSCLSQNLSIPLDIKNFNRAMSGSKVCGFIENVGWTTQGVSTLAQI